MSVKSHTTLHSRRLPLAPPLAPPQYLEKYLWPHFDPATAASVSAEHLMSIVYMVNEKFREGVAGWGALTAEAEKERFAALIKSLVGVSAVRELTLAERTGYVLFFVNLFQSLENEVVRAIGLPLVSLPLWSALSPGRLQLELARNPQLAKHWKFLQRKEAKAAKQPGHVPMERDPQVTFLPALVDHFVALLADAGEEREGGAEPVALTAQGLAYCEVRGRVCCCRGFMIHNLSACLLSCWAVSMPQGKPLFDGALTNTRRTIAPRSASWSSSSTCSRSSRRGASSRRCWTTGRCW